MTTSETKLPQAGDPPALVVETTPFPVTTCRQTRQYSPVGEACVPFGSPFVPQEQGVATALVAGGIALQAMTFAAVAGRVA